MNLLSKGANKRITVTTIPVQKVMSLPTNTPTLQYRPDIDGLRALAVFSVIGFHFYPEFIKGGFIGVDIFFVISGYLISSIILKNLDLGIFDFKSFYSRRIQRIFPALLFVLSASMCFGWFALLANEYQFLGKHITSGALFISNFVLWNEAGYFDKLANEKILLHLWSLGIEEQFYLLWPLLLWLACKLRVKFFLLIVFLSGASFLLNLHKVNTDIVAAFYSPQTRFWELLIGGLVAYLIIFKPKLEQAFTRSTTLANLSSFLGMLLICTGLSIINSDSLFPGSLALLPTIGSALLILSKSSIINLRFLSNPIMVWFGLISFPLYLWHWPVITFARIIEGEDITPALRTGLLIISIGLAWLTNIFLEKPVRLQFKSHLKIPLMGLLMIICGLMGWLIYTHQGYGLRSAITEFQNQEKSFLWPDENNTQATCISKYSFYGRYCLEGDMNKPPTVALIGDSHANHLFFGLSKYFQSKDQNLIMLGGWMPLWNVENGPLTDQGPRVFRRQSMDQILNFVSQSQSINTIILAFRENAVNAPYKNYFKLTTHPHLNSDDQILELALKETLARLIKTGKKIILIADIPGMDFNPKMCVDQRPLRLSQKIKAPCAIDRDQFEKYTQNYHAILAKMAHQYPALTVIPAYNYTCDEKNCYAMKNGKMIYRDDNHLSYEGSLELGERISKDLDALP